MAGSFLLFRTLYIERKLLLPEERAASQMSEFLRKYWFVCVLAVLFIGVLIFFISDLNKGNVKTLKADGTDVVASTSIGNVTSTDLYDASELSSARLLYNAYRNAVVDQTVKADSDMEKEAKTMAKNLESNMKADGGGQSTYSILSQLASFGFTGDSAVSDYAMATVKARKLDTDFIKANFDKLASHMPEGAKTVSILTMQVDNASILNDEDKKKQEDINKALEEKDFAEVAKEFSDDEATKEKGGAFGYIDASSTTLDQEVISAVSSMEAGQTTDWITVQPQGAQYYLLYRVHVDETDPAKLINSDNEEVVDALVTSMVNSTGGLEALAIQKAAEALTITYENDDIKKEVEDYQSQQTATLAAELGDVKAAGSEENASSEASVKESSQKASEESSQASSAAASSASSATSETEGE